MIANQNYHVFVDLTATHFNIAFSIKNIVKVKAIILGFSGKKHLIFE